VQATQPLQANKAPGDPLVSAMAARTLSPLLTSAKATLEQADAGSYTPKRDDRNRVFGAPRD